MPQTESPDAARSAGQIMDGLLMAFHPSGRDKLGLEPLPAEHQALEVGRIRWG